MNVRGGGRISVAEKVESEKWDQSGEEWDMGTKHNT